MQNDTFTEEQRLQFLGNKVLKKIFQRMKQSNWVMYNETKKKGEQF